VAQAASRGAGVVVLPEYSNYFVNPMDDTLAANAEGLDGEFTGALRALAAEHGVVVVAGMVEAADEGRVRNTVVAVSDAG
ncbi:nitrilase-related carbon-nitrogen hydrolase, partial [Escherichia coli]|uniref:nitrilase-related carbon-nitrogen hydrolase n=1 Tax=Escherichia coli TaxID=562 RepID=UPI0028E026E9